MLIFTKNKNMGNVIIHFGDFDEPSICGIDSENIAQKWDNVTCKKCLRFKERWNQSMVVDMNNSIKYMAGFLDFMQKTDSKPEYK